MKISVIGAGAFGTALGNLFASSNQEVLIFSSCGEKIDEINNNSTNKKYCQNFILSKNLKATNDLCKIFDQKDEFSVIFIALPSYGLEDFLRKNKDIILKNHNSNYLVFCTKGVSKDGLFFDEIVLEIFDDKFKNFGFILGPSFASEIICGAKTFVNLVSENEEISLEIIDFFAKKFNQITFVFEKDLKAAQVCSMMKNICAIFLGILRGDELHDDFCAAFFTLFFKEILILISYFSEDNKIISSFCGIGDLFLTTTSKKSRNFSFGFEIGWLNKQKISREDFILILEKSYKPEGFFALQNLFNSFLKKYNIPEKKMIYSKRLFDFFDKNSEFFFDFERLYNL